MTLQEEQLKLVKPQEIPRQEIDDDYQFNCRGKILIPDIEALAKDINVNGLMQPILVRPLPHHGFKYRIVAGFSRFKALCYLNWKIIPCIVRNCTDQEAMFLNLSENIMRRDLNFMQEAEAVRQIGILFPGLSNDDIGERLGQTGRWVNIRLYALSMPDEVKDVIARGYVTLDQITTIHNMKTTEEKLRAIRKIKEARERGIKCKLKPEPKPVVLCKATRTRAEIFAMQEHIVTALKTNNFGTRCLAWSANEIEDGELFRDIANIADAEEIPYVLPTRLEMRTRLAKIRGEE